MTSPKAAHIADETDDGELLSGIASHALQLNGMLNEFLLAAWETKGSNAPSSTITPQDLLNVAKQLYEGRRSREKFFAPELFGEPGWDILLDLYIAQAEGNKLSVTAACIGSCTPATTALRWIAVLERAGLLLRSNDKKDQRRTFLQLSTKGMAAMQDFLRTMARA